MISIAVRLLLVLASLAAIPCSPSLAAAEIYEYTDKHGTINFVDDPGKIPKQYRRNRKSMDDTAPTSSVTLVRINGNQVLVPVTIRANGRETTATMLLDTGASSTTISADLAQRLRISNDQTQTSLNRVADGGVIQSRRTKLSSITVGPHTHHGLDIHILQHEGPPIGFDGLLGMNFLRNHRYNIDFNSQQIVWGN